jgi:hypothetical protein
MNNLNSVNGISVSETTENGDFDVYDETLAGANALSVSRDWWEACCCCSCC